VIAIFGSNGYLGRHLMHYFSIHGECVEGFDLPDCDITQNDFWNGFNPQKYSAILFFAGLSGTEQSFKDAGRFFEVNVNALLLLLERLKQLGEKAPRIVFPSSRLVYRGGDVDEDSPVESRSVYATTKLACENILSAYYHRYGVPYCALRICVPFGNMIGAAHSYGTLGFFVNMARAGRPITVFGDGSNVKTYTYIGDLCEIVRRLCVCDCSGVFNVGGHDYSLRDVAEVVAGRYGSEISYVPWPEESLRVEMGSISLNSDKLKSAIGFSDYMRIEQCERF